MNHLFLRQSINYSSCRSIPVSFDNSSTMACYDFDNPIFNAEEEFEEDGELPEELARLLRQEEKVIQLHEEQLETINLGSDEDKKEVKIGAALEEDVKKGLIELLKEYVDVFAWSYADMPGLDTYIVTHKLPLREVVILSNRSSKERGLICLLRLKRRFKSNLMQGSCRQSVTHHR